MRYRDNGKSLTISDEQGSKKLEADFMVVDGDETLLGITLRPYDDPVFGSSAKDVNNPNFFRVADRLKNVVIKLITGCF